MTERQRFNSGYWDGRNGQGRSYSYMLQGERDALDGRHFDRVWADGYVAGYHDHASPTTSDDAWRARADDRKRAAATRKALRDARPAWTIIV